MSGVGASSTTNKLAGEVPYEKAASSDLPGTFPETPAVEPSSFSVNPIPATEGAGNPIKLAAGEPVPHHSNITANTIGSTVHDDKSLPGYGEPTFGVAPLPATAGAGNPISLAAGQPVPASSNFTANTVSSTATTDKASYENASGSAPVLPPVITPEAERSAKGVGILDLPPTSKNIIPESSLPMGTSGVGTYDASPMIASSAGPNTTTAMLAGAVPLQPKTSVPEVVKESQQAAGADPEASAIPAEVAEKSALEKELLAEVPKAPVTSDGTALHSEAPMKVATGVSAGEAAAAVGAAAVAAGGAIAGAAYLAKDKAVEATSGNGTGIATYLPESVQKSIADMNAHSAASKTTVDSSVPAEVKESIAESGQSPEAAAYSAPVAEKKAMEKELLAEVKPAGSSDTAAPAASTSGGVMSAKDTTVLPLHPNQEPKPQPPASIAAAMPNKEVLANAANDKSATPAVAAAPAVTALKAPQPESRDVSPGTIPGTHTQTAPVVTTGVAQATTEAKSEPVAPATPSKATPSKPSGVTDSPASTTTSKKDKRRSFFGKIKDKLSKDKN